jgi:tRNA threonylcarbamoyl adenosine modification protein YeaZ
MITLALDTSTDRGSVALLRDSKHVDELTFDRQVDEGLFPALQRLGAREFDRVAVGLGPGSFTGIRAGIAAAKGLALPGNLPVFGASSFDALALTAAPAMPGDCALICVLADARRGEICYRLYDRAAVPQGEHRLGVIEELADAVHDPIWFIGAEIDRYAVDLTNTLGGFAVVASERRYPSARAVGLLAQSPVLEPIYLRQPQYRQLS